MEDKIYVNTQSSIFIDWDKKIYIDPYKISKNYNDADFIFLTHSHYDHFSKVDMEKVINDKTKIVCPFSMKNEVLDLGFSNEVIAVMPGDEIEVDSILISAVHAYNIDKDFHKKSYGWVGYIIMLDDVRIYIAGDTDSNPDIADIKCDIALVPIGGVYTMNVMEAAEFINSIKPKVVIPIHYGSIVGEKSYQDTFKEMVNEDIKVMIKLF